MDKTRRKNSKSKKNKTKRRHKIMGGRESGYKAALVLWPSYDLDEEGKPTKFVRFKERFFTMHNLGIKRRTDYIDDWIIRNVENEPLVQENVVPVVHWLSGKHPKKTDATSVGSTVSDIPEYLNIDSTDYTRPPPTAPLGPPASASASASTPASTPASAPAPASAPPPNSAPPPASANDSIEKIKEMVSNKLEKMFLDTPEGLLKIKDRFKGDKYKIGNKQKTSTAKAAVLAILLKNNKDLDEFLNSE